MTRKNAVVTLISVIVSIILFWKLSDFLKRIRNLKKPTEHLELLRGISDIIIPPSDTPGGKEAGVSIFAMGLIENCLAEREKFTILLGFEDIEKYSRSRFSAPFSSCSMENKVIILEHFQDKDSLENSFLNKIKQKLLGPSFFELVKELIVIGYCTSEIGATQGLTYEHVPITYNACMPLLPNQRSWATA